jgi:HNH endonuclease
MNTLIERLVDRSQYNPTTGCLLWLGSTAGISSNMHGVIHVGEGRKKNEYVHIVSYKEFVGPIPEGHELHHLCNISVCWHPNHLEPRTRAWHKLQHQNGDSGYVCKHKHDLNVYGHLVFDGARRRLKCRECERNRAQKRRDKSK